MKSPCALHNVGGTSLYFLSKLCGGSPAGSFPLGYLSTPTPLFDGGQTLALRSTALAYYTSPASGAPINQSNLDALAAQFQADFLPWQQDSLDITYTGVVALAPVPIYDEIIIDYFDNGVCKTRAVTPPMTGFPRELGHADYSTTSGSTNCYDQPYAYPSCAYMYGPPAPGSGTSTVLNLYLVCLQDGRITSDYMGQDTFDCGCGTTNTTINTTWCDGCIAPGTITVTISEGSAPGGTVVSEGTANSSGDYQTYLAPGNYYVIASTTASGYYCQGAAFSVPTTGDTYVYCPLGPAKLTMSVSGLASSVSIYPNGIGPGGVPNNINSYWGSTSWDVPATQCCPAKTITLWYGFECGVAWFVKSSCTDPSVSYPCLDPTGTQMASINSGYSGSRCYPLSLTDTEAAPFLIGQIPAAMDALYGYVLLTNGQCATSGQATPAGQTSVYITITQ